MGLIEDRIAEMRRLNETDKELSDSPVEGTAAAAPQESSTASTASTAATSDSDAAAAATAATVATATAAERRRAALDDELPDDLAEDEDLIPKTLRGKSIRDLASDRKRAIQQRDEIGTRKNEAEAESRVLKNLLTLMLEQQQQRGAAYQAPAPEPTIEDRLRHAQIEQTLQIDPAAALSQLAELTTSSITPQIQQAIGAMTQRVERMEKLESDRRIQSAYEIAGRRLDRDMRTWKSDDEIETISGIVLSMGLPHDEPDSYVKAARWIDQIVEKRSPKPAPKPSTATSAQAAQAAAQGTPPPAPPVGTGPSATPSEQPRSQLDRHDAAAVDKVAKFFPQLTRDQLEKLASATLANSRPRKLVSR